jgi:hypothetical protein
VGRKLILSKQIMDDPVVVKTYKIKESWFGNTIKVTEETYMKENGIAMTFRKYHKFKNKEFELIATYFDNILNRVDPMLFGLYKQGQ